ncbi:MAG: phenylacetate--CoA ligase family protein [Gammaproteobacteria bacterium]|nr:phenylacetate--CoA ligase family protein [Gammaproteobacteria bacterium]
MTTYDVEVIKHRQWMQVARGPYLPAFDDLLRNEFLAEAQQQAWQRRALQRMVRYAAAQVPFYAALFARLGLRPVDIDDPQALENLPLLQKHDVLRCTGELRTRQLPSGERVATVTSSSGTTGRPVRVYHSTASARMFSLLSHRHARWFGFDPAGTMVFVCIPAEMPGHAERRIDTRHAVVREDHWRYVGQYFDTGPQYSFSIANPVDQQLTWMAEIRPQYVKGYPSVFEEWLFANAGDVPVAGLQALFGIGAQVTPALRSRLEQSYGIPVQQAYGLNEIGIVAGRCAAGRYHVHTEHCLVEIIAADGRACAPGQTGKVVVTGLRNFAMPLLRYDTGDLAVAVAGPCPCGRTLPAFGEIEGRYRRYAALPAGTKARVNTLVDAIGEIATEHLNFLRRYQIYQDRSNRFELRLVTAAPIPEAFRSGIARAWEAVAGDPAIPLVLREVEAIEPAPSGKLLDFASELHVDASVNPHATTASDRANGRG